ncbi:hypothetical protein [Liquorilactobacillus aquaticus]|nr:hypothetical protein [Liquorilactobacillus aquaticus]
MNIGIKALNGCGGPSGLLFFIYSAQDNKKLSGQLSSSLLLAQ